MRRHSLVVLSGLLWLLANGMAMAATPPAKVVQQFIDAHLQGHFAEARGFTIERVNVSTSLFSNWLFGAAMPGADAATADIFLSRKFAQAFRYTVLGTEPSGDNQSLVTVMRSSPNLIHMYTWALAPKQGAAPYELIEAIDTYLTKVNFPVEESRMQFTLIREVNEWYISAVHDEKFVQLQQQWLAQRPLSAAMPPPGAAMPPAAAPGTPSAVATGKASNDPGRQMADAQFNATLQSFNRTYQPPHADGSSVDQQDREEKPSLIKRVGRVLGIGSGKGLAARPPEDPMTVTFNAIRDALARYAVANGGAIPDSGQIYDWESLRRLVNQHTKKPLPTTEAEAGLSFVRYSADRGIGDYVLLLELHEPQDGIRRVEVTPYGIERAS